MNTDTNGNPVHADIRRERNGRTWAVTVWSGSGEYGCQNIRRLGGYPTRTAARNADVSDPVVYADEDEREE
jgi:hypothetical protein